MKRVAVIGAGIAGLVSVKSCIEEGLEPICYDIRDKVGGMWNYEEQSIPGLSSVYKGLFTNTSRHFGFSDFPFSEEYPTYLTPSHNSRYYNQYAERFGLKKYIYFKHKVLKVTPKDGRWLVRVLDLTNESESEEMFEAVIVCSGNTSYSYVPTIPGQDTFQGLQMHSREYKRPESFEGKNVVVVGFGNSGCDVAAECATLAKQVYFSTRRKGWLIPRILKGNTPIDIILGRRLDTFIASLLPESWMERKMVALANHHWDQELLGLKPKHKISEQILCVNDNLPMRLLSGQVKLVGSISQLTLTTVITEDSKEPIEADVIIYATGYKTKFPYLEDFMNIEEEIPRIYKRIFPFEYSTLAFVGMIYPEGPVNTVYELQARLISRLFSGKFTLPSRKIMEADCLKHVEYLKKRYGCQINRNINVNFTKYTNEIADLLGVNPRMLTLLFRDPALFWACLTGPLLPQQFRLHGPNPWPQARDFILNFKENYSA